MPFPLSSSSLGSLLSTWSQVCLSRQSWRRLCMVKTLMLKPNLLLRAPQLCREMHRYKTQTRGVAASLHCPGCMAKGTPHSRSIFHSSVASGVAFYGVSALPTFTVPQGRMEWPVSMLIRPPPCLKKSKARPWAPVAIGQDGPTDHCRVAEFRL